MGVSLEEFDRLEPPEDIWLIEQLEELRFEDWKLAAQIYYEGVAAGAGAPTGRMLSAGGGEQPDADAEPGPRRGSRKRILPPTAGSGG